MELMEEDINELKMSNAKVESEMIKLQYDIASMENQLRVQEKVLCCLILGIR